MHSACETAFSFLLYCCHCRVPQEQLGHMGGIKLKTVPMHPDDEIFKHAYQIGGSWTDSLHSWPSTSSFALIKRCSPFLSSHLFIERVLIWVVSQSHGFRHLPLPPTAPSKPIFHLFSAEQAGRMNSIVGWTTFPVLFCPREPAGLHGDCQLLRLQHNRNRNKCWLNLNCMIMHYLLSTSEQMPKFIFSLLVPATRPHTLSTT